MAKFVIANGELTQIIPDEQDSELVIPEGVTRIGASPFSGTTGRPEGIAKTACKQYLCHNLSRR